MTIVGEADMPPDRANWNERESSSQCERSLTHAMHVDNPASHSRRVNKVEARIQPSHQSLILCGTFQHVVRLPIEVDRFT